MSRERKKPWSKWYWGDWRKDARLRRCSYAARGLWIDMLSLMGGECDEFGYLVMEGQALCASDLAGLLGGSERDVQKLLAELESKWVFSRVGEENLPDDIRALVNPAMPVEAIFSRRMVRDKRQEEIDSENGRKGGNPAVKAHAPKNGSLGLPLEATGGLTGGDKAQSQNPESEAERRSSLRSDSRSKQGDDEPPGFAEWYDAYPRKKARPHAAKAYAAALKRGATPEILLAGARRYAEQRKHEDPRFTKHPATWLNADGWLDEEDKTSNGTGTHAVSGGTSKLGTILEGARRAAERAH